MDNDTITAAPETGLTHDPNAGHITTINTYQYVQVTPERAEEVLSYLVDAATMSHVPGFLSFNCHRTLIVNYGQWESCEAVMAARKNPVVVALMAETEKVAGSSNSRPYVLRKSVSAARK